MWRTEDSQPFGTSAVFKFPDTSQILGQTITTSYQLFLYNIQISLPYGLARVIKAAVFLECNCDDDNVEKSSALIVREGIGKQKK